MDNIPQLGTAADLELRAARIVDPGIDLKTKHTVACELREMIDTVRDADSARVLPQMIPVLLEILRSGGVSFHKDTLEFQFRRVLLEVLHRVPYSDVIRPQALPLLSGMLHILRHDNEENGLVAEFMSILQDVFRNIKGLVMPSIRSFKVLAEMGMVVVTFSQSHPSYGCHTDPDDAWYSTLKYSLSNPLPSGRHARTTKRWDPYWTGMAPTIKNPSAYADFVNAQIKASAGAMVSYVAYVIRGFGEQFDSFGERTYFDLMVVLRHLIGTPHRKALLPHIDKLFDEQVLLGTGIGSRETIRPAAYASLADLVHHLRGELSAEQLYSTLLHNPYLGHNLHTLFSKMMFGLIENITAKATPQACCIYTGRMTNILEMTIECVENAKRGEESQTLALLIERARPVAGAAYAVEKPEEVIQESRYLFRTLLHGFRVCLAGLKKCDGPIPDGTLIFRLFTSCIKCMVLIDAEPREATEIMDWFSAVLLEVNLHVFQEVQASVKRPTLLHICQTLFSREAVSPTLVAIVLRFLIDRLPQLGELFKMAFSAVTAFPGLNEPLLASHLAKLIMDCFPLAAKATKPTNYYHLLRGLFRAIGGGGGRFELLYKEVLPLLPEMLESLNRQLFASDGFSREMIVELCLTVPLRLTHLLPHLSYLMHPLALALRGSPELASQGLRTLELCIDNLTPDFLDPTLNTLGGRNRRLLSKEPLLEYNSERIEPFELGAMSDFAARTLVKTTPPNPYCSYAYAFLETCINSLLHEHNYNEAQAAIFVRCFEAILDALHIPEYSEDARKFTRELSKVVFAMEFRMNATKEAGLKRYPTPLLSSYLDAIPRALAREGSEEARRGQEIFTLVMQDLVAMIKEHAVNPQDVVPTLHQLANRFSAMCLEDSWVHKSAGYLHVKWVSDREVDFIRTLLHILKDLPHDLHRDVDEVMDVLKQVLAGPLGDAPVTSRPKLLHLIGILFAELSSPNPVVRQAVQGLTGKSAYELLLSHRDRMLTAIYTKPLRALSFPIQVGMIDAPLPELNDELLRLLHETLALADADDLNLGRVRLRVACIKLLTASMPMTDFFSKQIQTRQRVTGVYFKSLYSPSQEVKEVAHEGIARLPKELLQTGLRPVLMNLADPKRLSVSGLEGLARLLELLINYFKVEIGHKLLDHFRIVADPQMLQASSRLPLPESEGITKLVQLANIFHLLPSAANIFLESLVNAIVQTEAQMHFSDRSPFSEPLGKYLDRYPGEALDLFLRHLNFPRHLRTLRSILRARLAPNLERELSNNKSLLIPGLSLLDEIVDIQPNWTSENLHIVDVLIEIWHSERLELAQVDTMSSDIIHRHSLLLSIFKKILQRTSRVDLLFEVVDVYTRNLAMDLTRLTQFIYDQVALNMDLLYRRDVLTHFLIWFENSSASWATKTYFLRFIVTPTIIVQANNPSKDGLLDSEFISAVHRTIWQPMIDDTTFASADDMFKIELLHLTTVLTVKKDIIRCAWHYITSDDASRFFEAFDTPQKFILRAWTGLLPLDILAPALPKSGANDVGYPQWAKTTRRLLAEEGNGFQQIIMIYQLLVRQPHLFYPVRALFIPHMVNSLTKLGLSGTASTESRILSVDISQVIFDWEQKSMDSESQPTTSRLPAWTTPLAFRETIVSFLVRLATAPLDPQCKNSLVSRALVLLRQMVAPTGWSDVTVKLNYFSRTLEQLELDSESHLNQALSTAKVLQVVTGDKDDAWYTANATILQSLVRKGLITDESELHDTLHPIFDRLLRLFPLPDRDEKAGGNVGFPRLHGLSNTSAIRGILLMLNSVVQVAADRVQPFSASLLRLLSKLAKDHVNSGPNCQRIRQSFLGAFTALTEKSKSISLCRYMLDVMREWVLGKNNTYPTMKDKLNILQKMAGFESRGEQLFHDYLELPSLRRSDLTSRLEQCFLLGCRAKDTSLRERFMDLLDASIPRSPSARLAYILGVQSWEPLADHNWIFLALHLLLGSVDVDAFLIPERTLPFDPLAGYLSARQKAASIIRPMQRLAFLDAHSAHDAWVSIFSAAWKTLSRKEQADMTLHMINLLSKDYHLKQAELRPNVIQTLLSGVRACSPPMALPPHLVYAELSEEDMFYGLWRRRCLHLETNVGIAFEQNWDVGTSLPIHMKWRRRKLNTGTIAFSETEYCLWEDHWMLAAEKLQQWDTLYDLAKSEGNVELMLESAWRIKDWTEQRETLEDQINPTSRTVATPRRRVFEAFIALLKLPGALDKNTEFTKILEDAMQLSLRKWVSLPPHLSVAHQFVELQEAVQIFGSLSTTNAQNLEKKSSDLKMVLQAWRERLPNLQDDISVWSDLVAWRQNVFNAINKAYIPLIPNNNQASNTSSTNFNTAGYRGYHETAWIINRFAHVARKHDLLDVCFSSLNKIYTLPNIEISEAFLKLREQARCHYQKPTDLTAGLEGPQKAEFFTLKGMFHARAGRYEEASHAFAQAVQLDVMQAKAWAEWGRYNDRMFKEHPTEMSHAANAVSCYLQAAGQYKNRKSRPLLTRVLWLLSVDDTNFTISRAFDTYKGEAAFWYWISLIPQLCLSINQREAKQARYILLNLAKLFPQALFFPLRTTKEDMVFVKKQAAAAAAARAFNANHNVTVNGAKRGDGDHVMQDANGEVGSEITKRDAGVTDASGNQQSSHTSSQGDTTSANPSASQMALHTPTEAQPTYAMRHAWEHVDEVVQILKTAFPLLILTMETMVDQILQRFKATSEEEIYRLICMLLQDAIQNYVMRTNAPEDDGQLASHTISNITKMATNLAGAMRKEYEDDFLKSKPTHYEYIRRLQRWRDRQEKHLDSRPRLQSLDLLSHYLTEFQYSKFDDIEVPGQYTEDKDSNQNFVHIQRFGPKFENCRSHGYCWKRFTVHGNDHSKTSFS
ncbi:FAT domain-containing protein, partial [Pisolithus croceorrhizus]